MNPSPAKVAFGPAEIFPCEAGCHAEPVCILPDKALLCNMTATSTSGLCFPTLYTLDLGFHRVTDSPGTAVCAGSDGSIAVRDQATGRLVLLDRDLHRISSAVPGFRPLAMWDSSLAAGHLASEGRACVLDSKTLRLLDPAIATVSYVRRLTDGRFCVLGRSEGGQAVRQRVSGVEILAIPGYHSPAGIDGTGGAWVHLRSAGMSSVAHWHSDGGLETVELGGFACMGLTGFDDSGRVLAFGTNTGGEFVHALMGDGEAMVLSGANVDGHRIQTATAISADGLIGGRCVKDSPSLFVAKVV